MKSTPALINPQMLVWCREILGFSINEVAAKIKVEEEYLNKCERGEENISLNQLRKIADLYNQSVAIFYFKSPPKKKPNLGQDFRLLFDDSTDKMIIFPPELDPITKRKIFEVIDKRNSIVDIFKEKLLERFDYSWINSVNEKDNYLQVADKIRNFLNISIDKQFSWRSRDNAFEEWRTAIESKGVLVFYLREVEIEQIRGYAYPEKPLPIILINNRDKINAQIFTLIHEFCHLFTNSHGYCDPYYDKKIAQGSNIEIYANYVAGEILVPSKNLMAINEVFSHKIENDWLNTQIEDIAKKFKVSMEVILRRLVIIQKARRDEYQFYRESYIKDLKKEKPTETGGNYWNTYRSENSKLFIRLVQESFMNKLISINQAAHILNTKRNLIENVIPDIHEFMY